MRDLSHTSKIVLTAALMGALLGACRKTPEAGTSDSTTGGAGTPAQSGNNVVPPPATVPATPSVTPDTAAPPAPDTTAPTTPAPTPPTSGSSGTDNSGSGNATTPTTPPQK